MKPYGSESEKYWLRAVILPFTILWCHKVETFIWFMFVIVASQMGVAINVIYRLYKGWDLDMALAPDSYSGTFYTFCMVMVASLIGPLFNRFIRKEEPQYRNITMVFLTLLIFTLVFCAIFYGLSSQNIEDFNLSLLQNKNIVLDVPQCIFFILAILFSFYSFGLSFLREHEDAVKLADEYLTKENRNKKKLAKKASTTKEEKVTLNGKNVQI